MDILSLLGKDGIQPKRVSAGEYASPCPACAGRDRFRVWPAKGRYWCRGCGKSGDSIQYLMDFNGMTYRDACRYLGAEAKSSPARNWDKPKWEPVKPKEVAGEWRDMAEKFLDYCIKTLWTDPGKDALAWLRAERGFTDETIKFFRLGWYPADAWVNRRKWGLPEVINEQTGKPKKLWLPRGIVIPVGEPARIKIRRPDPGEGPRYYMLPGSSMQAMRCGRRMDVTLIVESECDAILLRQEAGDLVTAIALGSSSIRPDAATAEILKAAKLILVSLDSDPAGAKESWKWWKEHFPQSRRWPPVGGKDPGDMRMAGGDVRAWIMAAIQKYSSAGEKSNAVKAPRDGRHRCIECSRFLQAAGSDMAFGRCQALPWDNFEGQWPYKQHPCRAFIEKTTVH